MRTALIAALLIGATPAAAQTVTQDIAASSAAEAACDRACLTGYVDRYLATMQDGAFDGALFARDAKFTENGVRLRPGEGGLWTGMTDIGAYRLYVPDEETQQIAFLGTVREKLATRADDLADGHLVAVALRLKIQDGLITEVEQLAIRPDLDLVDVGVARAPSQTPDAGAVIEAMGAPHALYAQPIPEERRAPREALIETANHYFTGLSRNDGQGYYPFTDDCERIENGVPTAQANCREQFQNDLRDVVSRARDRRFVAVDPEHGLVFAFAFFDHDQTNWTWQFGEMFRIEDGQIRRIEAVFHQAPYGATSGWSTFEQGRSEAIQSVR